ncbi:site-specific DNA-methyltransferase [Rummeliibacillus suwonensis]|uniref:site-specific DNA-methyltransferase n=1 Tax=Rummeliibacillus suwonensis TaxID=1306154 RepID=UPI0011B499F6|nr:site-specific DNA-methyltransferase [Rummeliibacillus suwonensis]
MSKQMSGESLDITRQNIQKLKELFPEALTEGKIDFDLLRTILGDEVEDNNERYSFTWNGKKKAILGAQKPSKGTLRPDKEKSKNFDMTENLYIEGDNLEVLKLLQKSYNNKIKMIYIDPPYNTGNDFVYKDDFKKSIDIYLEQTGQVDRERNRLSTNTENNGRFHTDWLNMMYPRLKLARNLLDDLGVIFISIDENEVNNLKKMCDEIFGEINFIAQITTLCNPKGRSQDKYFATNHEYILIYSKSILEKGYFSIDKDTSQILNEYPQKDELGNRYRLLELRNTHREFGKHNRKNLYYPIFVDPLTGAISIEEVSHFIGVFPNWEDGFEGCWTWDKNKAKLDKHLLVAKKVKGKWKIYRKSYAHGATKMLKTIFNEKEFYTEKGQNNFSQLFETKHKIFQSPKSVDLIKTLIMTTVSKKDTIMDFFSGSATTAHATMQLNAEDGGKRKGSLSNLVSFKYSNNRFNYFILIC